MVLDELDPKSDIARIIRKLQRLKKAAFKERIEFYKKWNKLREMLYNTVEYKDFLREIRERAGYRCEKCASPGRQVHHKIRVYDNPTLCIDRSNGIYLCTKCHHKEHSKNGN